MFLRGRRHLDVTFHTGSTTNNVQDLFIKTNEVFSDDI